MKCLANDDVTYEDIVAQARNSSQSRSYFKHLFAYGGLNLDTVAQLERNDLQATALHPLPNGPREIRIPSNSPCRHRKTSTSFRQSPLLRKGRSTVP